MSENCRLFRNCRQCKDLTKLFIKRDFILLLVYAVSGGFIGFKFF